MKKYDKVNIEGGGALPESTMGNAGTQTAPVMHFESKLAGDGSLLTIRAGGYPDLDRFLAGLATVAASPLWSSSTGVLCDLRELYTTLLPPGRVMQAVLAIRHDRSKRYRNPIAVVVSRPADYGTVRTWDVYLQEILLLRNYFYSVNEALDWLAGEMGNRGEGMRVEG
jgi:hypothetical protein